MLARVLRKGIHLVLNNQTVVVFDKQTKEVIACVSISGKQAICRNDVDFKIYNGTEPVFAETGNRVLLNENAFILSIMR